jgi:hypothetical protein
MIESGLKNSKIEDLLDLEEQHFILTMGKTAQRLDNLNVLTTEISNKIKFRNNLLELRNDIATIAEEYISDNFIHNRIISKSKVRRYMVKGLEVDILKLDEEIKDLKNKINQLLVI